MMNLLLLSFALLVANLALAVSETSNKAQEKEQASQPDSKNASSIQKMEEANEPEKNAPPKKPPFEVGPYDKDGNYQFTPTKEENAL